MSHMQTKYAVSKLAVNGSAHFNLHQSKYERKTIAKPIMATKVPRKQFFLRLLGGCRFDFDRLKFEKIFCGVRKFHIK